MVRAFCPAVAKMAARLAAHLKTAAVRRGVPRMALMGLTLWLMCFVFGGVCG
jgi:hypothetical protein